ncbi:GNAT family N-acetyltransferase [Pseudooceanicola nanhaiensis]|uniref:GNAT family N-acetyltransferase n=1 Tax=Pseudooceanicola nanhaiensis TaxID=375761 RepID=UPI001CD2C616|nr:GNAT family N-acetyltransferase [Pseudooceanicola nanhaiensis]MCA0922129.1 GNAT family N-acetyltransferase [Pseudooceanicola nanhaiensis]
MSRVPDLFPAIPVVEAERVILRGPKESDFETVVAFEASDRKAFIGGPVDRWGAWQGFLAVLGHWALRGYGFWTVEERATGLPVGRIGVIYHHETLWPEPELGWHMFEGAEGKGLAHDAAVAARAYAAEAWDMAPLISQIHPDNIRSRKLAERMGCVVERESTVLDTPVLIYRHPDPRKERA